LLSHLRDFLWPILGYNNSFFDNRFMNHVAGGYMVNHIASLFLKNYYWMASFFVSIVKELLDHFVFGCGGNEIKHLYDILGWNVGGISYYAIVLLKRRKYGYKS